MDERLARLEAVVSDLTGRVAELEARLAQAGRGAPLTTDLDSTHDRLTAVTAIGAASVQQWLALVGRTLVVLGGAYLLRAITESHVVTPQAGVALGLIYGAPWLLLASRAEGRGAHLDALCHALSTALISRPRSMAPSALWPTIAILFAALVVSPFRLPVCRPIAAS